MLECIYILFKPALYMIIARVKRSKKKMLRSFLFCRVEVLLEQNPNFLEEYDNKEKKKENEKKKEEKRKKKEEEKKKKEENKAASKGKGGFRSLFRRK